MTWIKIGLVQFPHMLRAILSDALGKAHDIEVVDVPAIGEVFVNRKVKGLDAIVMATVDDNSDAVCQLLVENPDVAILVVNRDAKFAHVYELRRETINDPSAEAILEVLRRVARQRSSGQPD